VSVHPVVRLLRPALAPTAAADVLAAAAFVGGAPAAPLALACAASVCLYAGGMVQNDLLDRAKDREIQPDRPLVVDPRLVRTAILLTVGLGALGIVLGALAGAWIPAVAVAVLATAYNGGLKRVFPADGVVMGGARAANFLLGVVAAGAAIGGPVVVYAGGYLVYIAGVNAASRAEDLEPMPTRRLALLLATLLMAVSFAGFVFLAANAARAAVFVVPLGLLAWALVAAMRAGTRPAAKKFVFRCLLLTYVLHAGCLWSSNHAPALIGILACAAATCFVLALLAQRP